MNFLNIKPINTLPVAKELNQLLADYHLYYQKLRGFHWNVVGKNFFELHNKFEEMYKDAKVKIDEIAERVLTLQHQPINKYSEYLEMSSIQEGVVFKTDSDMIFSLLEDHKVLLQQMTNVIDKAQEIKDEGTIDLIGSYVRELEKVSWMFTAWTKTTVEQLEEDLVLS